MESYSIISFDIASKVIELCDRYVAVNLMSTCTLLRSLRHVVILPGVYHYHYIKHILPLYIFEFIEIIINTEFCVMVDLSLFHKKSKLLLEIFLIEYDSFEDLYKYNIYAINLSKLNLYENICQYLLAIKSLKYVICETYDQDTNGCFLGASYCDRLDTVNDPTCIIAVVDIKTSKIFVSRNDTNCNMLANINTIKKFPIKSTSTYEYISNDIIFSGDSKKCMKYNNKMTMAFYDNICDIPEDLFKKSGIISVTSNNYVQDIIAHPQVREMNVTAEGAINSMTFHKDFVHLYIKCRNNPITETTEVILNGAKLSILFIPYNVVDKFDLSYVTHIRIKHLRFINDVCFDKLCHISMVVFDITPENIDTVVTEHFLMRCRSLQSFDIVMPLYKHPNIKFCISKNNKKSSMYIASSNKIYESVLDIFHDYSFDSISMNYSPLYKNIIRQFRNVYLRFGNHVNIIPNKFKLNIRFNNLGDNEDPYDLVFGPNTTYIRIIIRNLTFPQTVNVLVPNTVVAIEFEFVFEKEGYNIMDMISGIPDIVTVIV